MYVFTIRLECYSSLEKFQTTFYLRLYFLVVTYKNGSIQYVRLKYFSYEGILTGRLVEYRFLEVLLQFLDLLKNKILPREYYKNTMKLFVPNFFYFKI